MKIQLYILLAACLQLSPVLLCASSLRAETLGVNQFDQGTIIRRKLSNAERLMREQHDYENARRLIDEVLKIDSENTTALSLLKELNQQVQQAGQTEKEMYEEAVASNSLEALQQFLRKYPQGKYTEDVQRRIKDFGAWKKAVQTGTVSGYENYLATSDVLAYQAEAQAAIRLLKEQEAWAKVQDTEDPDQLADFLSRYPDSKQKQKATYRLNMLRGNYFFELNQTDKALKYYQAAQEIAPLTGTAFSNYQELKEREEYEQALMSEDDNAMRAFLDQTPQTSKYYAEMSNRLALRLASRLNTSSTEKDFNEALSYVRDEQTGSSVNYLISQTRQAIAEQEQLRRREAHRRWWKQRLRMGWNAIHFDYYDHYMSAGSGLSFRLGIPRDFLNIVAGVDYYWQGYAYLMKADEHHVEDELEFSTIANQIEIPLGLRFNIGRGDNGRFFLGCNADFGFSFGPKENELRKKTLAFEPQIGYATLTDDDGMSVEFGIIFKQYLKGHGLFSYTDEKSKMRFGLFLGLVF